MKDLIPEKIGRAKSGQTAMEEQKIAFGRAKFGNDAMKQQKCGIGRAENYLWKCKKWPGLQKSNIFVTRKSL